MVDDPEKHIDSTGQYKKPDPWEKRTTQKQEKGKELRGTKHSLPNYTHPCANMQSLSDNSILFEAFNARTCVYVYKAWF